MPVWEEHSYSRKDENGNIISLEEYEATHPGKAFTWADFKLYAICGVGFMLDSYDLFIVNLASPIWAYEFYTTSKLATTTKVPPPTIPFLVRGAVNAAANIGNVLGQLSFGFMGDVFGRKFVYGKELIIAIIGIIMIISLPVNGTAGLKKGTQKMWWLFGFRMLLGIGIGGDYPMSAAIVAERSTLGNRGRMLGWIFSNQGWVSTKGCRFPFLLAWDRSQGPTGNIGCFRRDLYSPSDLQEVFDKRPLHQDRWHLAAADRFGSCAMFRSPLLSSHHARIPQVHPEHRAILRCPEPLPQCLGRSHRREERRPERD
jgi:hypothetical protein